MCESDGGRELAGSAAIVTGSIKNMGRMIAIALGEAGASVLINGRTSTAAAETVAQEVVRAGGRAGGRAVVHMADVTDSGQVAGMIARAADTFGRLDILVNNVSSRIAKPVAEITLDEWQGVIASTLDGAFLCTRAALPHLEASDRAAIVNIGGVSGHAGVANRTAVAAAKAGLAGLTGSLAAEFASRDITVNCIAPGPFRAHRRAGPYVGPFPRAPDPARPRRPARGHRRHGLDALRPARTLHHRPNHPRQRRLAHRDLVV